MTQRGGQNHIDARLRSKIDEALQRIDMRSHHRLSILVVLHALASNARIGAAPDGGHVPPVIRRHALLVGERLDDHRKRSRCVTRRDVQRDGHVAERDLLAIGDDHVLPGLELRR